MMMSCPNRHHAPTASTYLEEPLNGEVVHADVAPVEEQATSVWVHRGGLSRVQLRILDDRQAIAAGCKHADLLIRVGLGNNARAHLSTLYEGGSEAKGKGG